jgi:hypothetical protein
MPLLEVVQTRQISASIRLTDTTAVQVDQYAASAHVLMMSWSKLSLMSSARIETFRTS